MIRPSQCLFAALVTSVYAAAKVPTPAVPTIQGAGAKIHRHRLMRKPLSETHELRPGIVRGRAGSTVCPDGYVRISSKDDCQRAAKELGATWRDDDRWKGPSCSFVVSHGNRQSSHHDGYVYFNARDSSTSTHHATAEPVCTRVMANVASLAIASASSRLDYGTDPTTPEMQVQEGLGLCTGPDTDFSSGADLPSGFSVDSSVVGYRDCGGDNANLDYCKQLCIDLAACQSMSTNANCCFLYEADSCPQSSHGSTSEYTTYFKVGPGSGTEDEAAKAQSAENAAVYTARKIPLSFMFFAGVWWNPVP